MTNILFGAGVLGVLGLGFGLLLTLVNKIFEVPVNPKFDEVRAALPGANCGGCGYAGCDALADAIVNKGAPTNACPVGGKALSQQIAEVMGVVSEDAAVRKIATVVCQGGADQCKDKFEYHGIRDCVAAMLVDTGNRTCQYACLGLGTCEHVCKFDAIYIDKFTNIAKVDPEKCQSCGVCVASCPKSVLSLQPETQPVRLLCRAAEEGTLVSDHCKNGCVGCAVCADQCKFDAITMVNHLPQMDMERCVGCMICAETCPTGAIWGDFNNRKIAVIKEDDCIGCGLCKRVCEFEAITGVVKHPHEISQACTGCGLCVAKCPKKCITLRKRDYPRDVNAKIGTQTTEAAVPKDS